VVLIQSRVAASFARGEKTKAELLNLMAGGEEFEDMEEEIDAMRRAREAAAATEAIQHA
jgi:hypothetical protein